MWVARARLAFTALVAVGLLWVVGKAGYAAAWGVLHGFPEVGGAWGAWVRLGLHAYLVAFGVAVIGSALVTVVDWPKVVREADLKDSAGKPREF